MSDTNDPFVTGSRNEMRREVTRQFMRGGGAGIVAFIGFGVFVYGLYIVSLLLPPESKEAADPTPDSFPNMIEAEE